MVKFLKIFSIVLTLVLLLTACRNEEPEPAAEPSPPYVDEVPIELEHYSFAPETFPRMDGSPATAPLAQALAAVMLGQSREDVSHRAMFTRTTQSFRDLAGGASDILIAGEPAPAVLDEISAQDFRYDMAPIAADALVFIVSKSNPVDNLTSEQVKAIYTGQITGWQQVGGHDLDIAAYQRNEEATSQVLLEMLVTDWNRLADAPMQTVMRGYDGDDPSLTAIKGFDGSANAIGYTMHHYAVNMNMADAYKILSIDGILPTPDTISSGVYPFINPYYAVINRDLPEDDPARILYNWLLSEAGQDFVASQGYVSARDAGLQAGSSEGARMKWDVVTDNSRLTPYDSPRSQFTALYNTAMPSLEEYSGYGPLLPYSTAVTMNDGSIHVTKFGFVAAQSGTVVTDPVYDGVYQATYFAHTGSVALPAYSLHMNLPEGDPDYGFRTLQAVCAADGSWITPFSYSHTVFRENVMFLIYSDDTFDIDVYDYDGNLLYNILDLDWADRIAENEWPYYLMYGEGENVSFIQLDDGTYALMDLLTGEIQETDIAGAASFSDGLACVVPSGNALWGFVDKDLEFVIEPAYADASVFVHGRAIVETPDGKWHVIDTSGDFLYTADEGRLIQRLRDGYGYIVRSISEIAPLTLLTYDFAEIEYPPEVLPLSPETSVSYINNGWFLCQSEDGVWLFSDAESYPLPASVQNVSDFIGGFVVFTEFPSGSDLQRAGVMLPDGTVIVAPGDGQRVTPVAPLTGMMPTVPATPEGQDNIRFAVNTLITGSESQFFIAETYERLIYRLVGSDGQLVKSDLGILSYDEAAGYLYVQGTDYFAWLRPDGSTFISIPSMAYTYD